MGFYLDGPATPKGKAGWFLANAKAEELPTSGLLKIARSFSVIPPSKMLVCIVDNGNYEAAGICFDHKEFARFVHPDPRPSRWFLIPKEEIIKLAPHLTELVRGEKNWRE